jgi:DNA-binding NarL/FixJ family response regulator
MSAITVAIVEDDPNVREMLTSWVRAEPDLEWVGAWGNGVDAVKALPDLAPKVVLMDINLPGLSGIDCVARLKPGMPHTQFLMLTIYEDANHIYNALSVGASGYLIKETRRAELATAIRDLHAGGSPMTGSIARKVVRAFQAPCEIAALSPREHEVLEMLAQGYIYKEIADQMAISVTTVACYIRRIYEKLHVRSRAQAVAKLSQIPSLRARSRT